MSKHGGVSMSVLGSVTLPRNVSRGMSGGGVSSMGVSGQRGVSSMGVSGVSGQRGVSESPYRSIATDGDRPELELDMWEGQFNLSDDNVHGLTMDMVEELMPLMFNNDINMSATKWEKESEVTCTTVSKKTMFLILSRAYLSTQGGNKTFFKEQIGKIEAHKDIL